MTRSGIFRPGDRFVLNTPMEDFAPGDEGTILTFGTAFGWDWIIKFDGSPKQILADEEDITPVEMVVGKNRRERLEGEGNSDE